MIDHRPRRTRTGALIAEHAGALSVLFLLIFFPLVDYSIVGVRAFMLWFAADRAVAAASKAKTYLASVDAPSSSGTAPSSSACGVAREKARQIISLFSGIHWIESDHNPDVRIIRQPINPTAKDAQPVAVFSLDHGAPLAAVDAPEPNRNVYFCQVILTGEVEPLLTIPWMKIPGLSSPFNMTVTSQAQYENVSGLVI